MGRLVTQFVFALCILGCWGEWSLRALSLRDAVAYAWAPSFFKDFAHEFTDPVTGFNPVDHPVDIFFNGRDRVSENHKAIFRMDVQQQQKALERVPVYYSVIETLSHYYINYFLYHAVDLKKFGHAHDTENVFTIVEKDGSPYGRLVSQITNAHGYPMIYAPNETEQNAWRARVNKAFAMAVMSEMDRFSKDHHERGFVEYIQRPAARSLMTFVSSRSHAIYKFNSSAWREGRGMGAIYIPPACPECRALANQYSHLGLFEYHLVNWDEIFFESMEKSPNVFVRRREGASALSFFSNQVRDLPDHIVPGLGELTPRVNLFHSLRFRSPYPLALPAAVHSWFNQSKEGISFHYLHNPYIQMQPRRDRSSWTLISEALGRQTFAID